PQERDRPGTRPPPRGGSASAYLLTRAGLLARGSSRLTAFPGLESPSGFLNWSAAPHSQLRDSAGSSPASLDPGRFELGRKSTRHLRVGPRTSWPGPLAARRLGRGPRSGPPPEARVPPEWSRCGGRPWTASAASRRR